MRREALAKESAKTQPAANVGNAPLGIASPTTLPAILPPLRGEVLPPIKTIGDDLEITRTALKRAMRKRAADFSEKAIEVLSENLKHADPEIRQKAANDLLKWGFGNPQTDIEVGKEGLSIAILRFGQEGTE